LAAGLALRPLQLRAAIEWESGSERAQANDEEYGNGQDPECEKQREWVWAEQKQAHEKARGWARAERKQAREKKSEWAPTEQWQAREKGRE